MEHARKVVMSPYEEEKSFTVEPQTPKEPPKKKNWIKERALEKQKRLLKIVLKLAKVDGYDTDFHIKLRNGEYLEQSDVVALIAHVLSPGQAILGLKEFIELLYDAKVDPSLIANDHVKSLLERMYRSPQPMQIDETPPRRVEKRVRFEEQAEPEPISVKRKYIPPEEYEQVQPTTRVARRSDEEAEEKMLQKLQPATQTPKRNYIQPPKLIHQPPVQPSLQRMLAERGNLPDDWEDNDTDDE